MITDQSAPTGTEGPQHARRHDVGIYKTKVGRSERAHGDTEEKAIIQGQIPSSTRGICCPEHW